MSAQAQDQLREAQLEQDAARRRMQREAAKNRLRLDREEEEMLDRIGSLNRAVQERSAVVQRPNHATRSG
jgi:hypothetical protein